MVEVSTTSRSGDTTHTCGVVAMPVIATGDDTEEGL
jgi:hypothetical protein